MGWKGEKAPAIISRTMKEADNVKKRERDTYDAIAEAYDKVHARYNAFFASDMIDMLFPQKYDAGLDVAGGSGTAGLKGPAQSGSSTKRQLSWRESLPEHHLGGTEFTQCDLGLGVLAVLVVKD